MIKHKNISEAMRAALGEATLLQHDGKLKALTVVTLAHDGNLTISNAFDCPHCAFTLTQALLTAMASLQPSIAEGLSDADD